MHRINSNPPHVSAHLSHPNSESSIAEQAPALRLDLRLAKLDRLPPNPWAQLVDNTLYEVCAPEELADRILCRVAQPFWLLHYNSLAIPLHEPAQRLLQVFNQPDNNSIVVREENVNEHQCPLNGDRLALIRFLVDRIGPTDLVFQPTAATTAALLS